MSILLYLSINNEMYEVWRTEYFVHFDDVYSYTGSQHLSFFVERFYFWKSKASVLVICTYTHTHTFQINLPHRMNSNSYQIEYAYSIHTSLNTSHFLSFTYNKNGNSHNNQFVIRHCASHRKSNAEQHSPHTPKQ